MTSVKISKLIKLNYLADEGQRMMVYEELALILLPLIGKLRKIAKFNVIPPPPDVPEQI